MADKNDGKPGDTGASSNRPKPLLDLKATEVRGASSSSDAKPAETSNLKGAPGWKEPSADSRSSSVPSSGSSSSRATQPSTSSRMESPSPASTPATSGSSSSSGSASTSSGKGSSSRSTSTSAGATTSAAAADTKPGDKTSKPAVSSASTAKASPPASPRSSGGGFFSTVSHLAAGIIGGGIALFAAGPIDKELNLGLLPKAEMPVALERRLAALESRPSGGGTDVATKQDLTQLAAQVAAAEKQLARLDSLGKEVAALAGDVSKVRAGAPAGSSAATASAGDGSSDSQAAALRTRLAKLESTLTTLSSATIDSGKPSAIAPLAQFSAKFADLEGSLNTQLGALRTSLMSEMDSRISKTSASSEKAVAGAERLDREVSDIKTETARLEQRSTVLKTASDKLAVSLRAVSEQAAELKVELDSLKGDVKQELAKVARPADVEQAIAPVSEKVASIEKNLGSVLATESARKQNAERIVLSLELSNLKRVLDRGAPYASELADVKKIAGGAIDFAALEAHKSEGVPSGQELTRQFRGVAYKIIGAEDAPTKDASRIDKLFAAAKAIVKVRRTDVPAEEKTAEAAVARIEKHLKAGDMTQALALAEKLPEKSKAPAQDWLSKLAARAGVDRAIAKIEDQLKASLGAAEKKG